MLINQLSRRRTIHTLTWRKSANHRYLGDLSVECKENGHIVKEAETIFRTDKGMLDEPCVAIRIVASSVFAKWNCRTQCIIGIMLKVANQLKPADWRLNARGTDTYSNSSTLTAAP